MAKRKELSAETRSAVITLHKENYSLRQIAKKLKLTYRAVQGTVKRYKTTGTTQSGKRSGRPKITSPAEDRRLEVISKRNRRLTAPQIRAQLNESRETPVSLTTVKRRLAKAGLQGRIAARKPLLRPQNRQKRLKWAKEHQNWNIDMWKTVLWTDESKFQIFGSNRRVYVRRRRGERMREDCVVPTVKHGGGSVLVWGAFSFDGVGNLHRINGILTKERYKAILEEHAIPSGLQLIGEGFHLQQDNDPKHTARLCRNYLQQQEADGILVNMIWPPQSPDLNPIELLWDELDRRVREHCARSQQQLWEHLQEAWNAIPVETLQRLVLRMPKICKAVIKCGGGYFSENKIK